MQGKHCFSAVWLPFLVVTALYHERYHKGCCDCCKFQPVFPYKYVFRRCEGKKKKHWGSWHLVLLRCLVTISLRWFRVAVLDFMVCVLFHFFNFASYKLRMFSIIDENQAFSKSSCIAENLVVISLTIISYHHAKTSLWIWCYHLLFCVVSLNVPNCSDIKGIALVLLHAFKLYKLLKQL